jgi:O-antigen/teichoic acid export membrane protein
MRLAGTAVFYFITQVIRTGVGFLATLYFARNLGADILGKYFVVVALLAWINIPWQGINTALSKRLSEQEDQDEFFSSALSLNIVLFAIMTFIIIVLRDYVNRYVGVEVHIFLIYLIAGQILLLTAEGILQGENKVEWAGITNTVDQLARACIQVLLIAIGFSFTGLLIGHAAGLIMAGLLGFVLIDVKPSIPDKKHLESIYSYAKFAWLGKMKYRTFGWMDTLVLNLFVASSFIGVYEIAWSIASFLVIGTIAISSTLFPEISKESHEENLEEVRNLLDESLVFAGILSIPGIFGALVLGSDLLRIYGEEFTQGAWILTILVLARTIGAYSRQTLNTINAVNRPDVAFRINSAFIISNIILNITLIYLFGWYGAAIATAVSTGIILGLSYRSLCSILGSFQPPYKEIAVQVSAGAVMGVIVWVIREFSPWNNLYAVVGMVFFGAGVYFLLLVLFSGRIRRKFFSLVPQSQS